MLLCLNDHLAVAHYMDCCSTFLCRQLHENSTECRLHLKCVHEKHDRRTRDSEQTRIYGFCLTVSPFMFY